MKNKDADQLRYHWSEYLPQEDLSALCRGRQALKWLDDDDDNDDDDDDDDDDSSYGPHQSMGLPDQLESFRYEPRHEKT